MWPLFISCVFISVAHVFHSNRGVFLYKSVAAVDQLDSRITADRVFTRGLVWMLHVWWLFEFLSCLLDSWSHETRRIWKSKGGHQSRWKTVDLWWVRVDCGMDEKWGGGGVTDRRDPRSSSSRVVWSLFGLFSRLNHAVAFSVSRGWEEDSRLFERWRRHAFGLWSTHVIIENGVMKALLCGCCWN